MATIMVDGVEQPMSPALAGQLPSKPDLPASWMVSKLIAVDRLIAAGKASALLTKLALDANLKLRFDAAVELRNDDPLVVSVLRQIGADPLVILARPE